MKTPKTIKLRRVQTGIERRIAQFKKRSMKVFPEDTGFRRGLVLCRKIIRQEFESYR